MVPSELKVILKFSHLHIHSMHTNEHKGIHQHTTEYTSYLFSNIKNNTSTYSFHSSLSQDFEYSSPLFSLEQNHLFIHPIPTSLHANPKIPVLFLTFLHNGNHKSVLCMNLPCFVDKFVSYFIFHIKVKLYGFCSF